MKNILVIVFLMFISGIGLFSQTASQNYILTRTYTNDANTTYLDNIGYFDGLGRPVETVQKGITPAKADLVTYREYDAYGREYRIWLPAVASGNNGAYMTPAAYTAKSTATYNNTTYNAAADTKPYSYRVYESSPLNRITERYEAGADWHNNGKSIKTGFLTNIAKSGTAWVDADSLVCGRYVTTDDKKTVGLYRTDNYAASVLYVTRTIDENGNKSYKFKDKHGQTVLTRQINAGKSYDTNYIYDSYGNLRAVLPPEASARLLSATSSSAWTESNNDLKLYAYLYKYDDRNRCIAKKLPGCEWILYIYDKADRLIFKQDGENSKKSEWQFSIPDAFGRIVLTGTCKNTFNYAADPLKTVVAEATRLNATNTYKGYSTPSGATPSTPTILTVNYYDDYAYLSFNGIPNNADAQYVSELSYGACYGDHQAINAYKNKGLLTGGLTAQMNPDGTISSAYLYSVMYYDYRGRIVQTKSNNHFSGGIEKEYLAYDFTGRPMGKKHIHQATGKTTQTEIFVNSYDHAERLTKTTHQLNGGTITTIAENTYDELGRLKTNKKGENTELSATYAYNIRSWVKSITGPLFTETLYYNEIYDTATKMYNGNLSGMTCKLMGDANTFGYAFTYDNLSRLTVAYSENSLESNRYRTTYNYDRQGNILNLTRGGKTTATAWGTIDNLTMNYSGNQLIKAEDTAPNISLAGSADFKNYSNTTPEYTYNANGAMTKDLNKGISDIQYNLLNLPRIMDIKSPVAEARNEYTYSAVGQKLKVVQKWNPNYSTTPVIGSAVTVGSLTMSKTTDYIGNMIYENGTLKRILIDGGYWEDGTYNYYLTDHQGNNRLTVSLVPFSMVPIFPGPNSGAYTVFVCGVMEQNHYYPFGMMFADKSTHLQPYKYNGKELDMMNGLNQYDYSARYYDPAIARFTTVDPMAEKYYSVSPYAYCMNNPVRYVDPDGRDVRPIGREALEMIQNTLTKDDMKYVRFDADGNIDKDYLNSHTSESGNYGDLLKLVNSDIITEVSLVKDKISYMDNNGVMKPMSMPYFEADPEFADPQGLTSDGVSTGETGRQGITLLPGKGKSGANSPDEKIHVFINGNFSSEGRAEAYSHEANGHALFYVNTKDRNKSAHDFREGGGTRDYNLPLVNAIKKSKQETIKNMNSRKQ